MDKFFIGHLKRLELRNKELMKAVISERKLRKLERIGYRKSLRSRFMWIFDYLIIMHGDKG